MTKEERLLRNAFLRKYPLQFRRQYIIGSYIVDFYCHRARLIVELDGSQHYNPDMQRRDIERTAFLEAQGCYVLRLPNNQVLQNFKNVCEDIDRIASERAESFNTR